jgi:anti-sigma-K factor RskA
MKHQDIQNLLHDYVDGTLGEAERGQVEAHLESCTACRQEIASLRRLLEQAARLPHSIEPARDMWPQIADRFEQRKVVRAEFAQEERRSVWVRRILAVAAGVVLVVVSSVTTYKLTAERQDREPAVAVQGDISALRVELVSLESDYSAALTELSRTLHLRRDRLSPETVEVVEKNLQIIDAAITEASEALDADPGNPYLLLAVASMYKEKVDLLQRLTHLPEGI